MTVAVDLAAPLPGSWVATARAAFFPEEARRSIASRWMASWSTAILAHIALGLLAIVAFTARTPPTPPQTLDALSVEIVVVQPEPVEEPGTEEAEAPPAAPEEAAPETPTEQQFDVVLPNRPWPQVLLREGEASAGAQQRAVPYGVPSNIRQALATAYYCRSTALGIAAELRRCPPALDQFRLAARVEALDPLLFVDPNVIVVRRTTVREAPPSALPGLYGRGQTEGILPPKYPDPAFGG